MGTHRSYLETLSAYAALSAAGLRSELSARLRSDNLKLVVFDDDPTGIQTVHGCLLLTDWSADNLDLAFLDEAPLFYLLTNTRSMTDEDAARITAEAVRAVVDCNRKHGFGLVFISRSDSTLRGHFPVEPETIRRVLDEENLPVWDTHYFLPAFFEAGRYTLDGVQYLKQLDELIPVSETEFARDNVFGYENADLNAYIVEKSKGRISSEQIGRIGLDMLRRSTVTEIEQELERLSTRKWVTVDALDYDDLWRFSLALLQLRSKKACNLLLRTSSSLPKAMSGMDQQALLDKEQCGAVAGTGLIVVGSHVAKSSEQLLELLKSKAVRGMELDVRQILETPDELFRATQAELLKIVRAKRTPVVYTSRTELRFDLPAERLEKGRRLSEFLVRLVKDLPFEPSFLVAKGGITAHDLLTKGLDISIARVAGQLLPGVPVVHTDSTHRFPHLPFVIFPGNVGDRKALRTVFDRLA